MSREVLTALVQLLISLGGAGLVVQLLLLRQNRRKIAGEASTSEANAASTLSGAALTMVENAQADAREARANAREDREEAERAREAAERNRVENERLHGLNNAQKWRIHHLEMRERVLESMLRALGHEPPPAPEYEERQTPPPSIEPGPTPGPSLM